LPAAQSLRAIQYAATNTYMVTVETQSVRPPTLDPYPHRALLVALATGQLPAGYLVAAYGLTEAELHAALAEASHVEKWD
jgi:hypothetical protein